MKKSVIFAILAAFILVSCGKEEQTGKQENGRVLLTFNALFTDVRAAITTDGAEKGKVVWEEGDVIRIWDGVSVTPVTLTSGDLISGGESATFTADVSSAPYYVAVYGSDSRASIGVDGKVSVTPSATSTGDFTDEHLAVACCSSSSPNLVFRNVMSVVRFTLPSAGIDHVVFSTADGSAFKTVTIDPSDFSTEYTASAINEITVDTDASATGASYCVSLPGDSAVGNGFVLDLYNASDVFQGHCYTVKSLPAAAGKLYNLGEMVPDDMNYLRGGSFSTGEEMFWTCVNNDGGAGKGAGVRPSQASVRDGVISYTITERCYHAFYQKVTLTAGTYRMNANYYNAGNSGNGGRTYVVVTKSAPQNDATFESYNASNVVAGGRREGNVNTAQDALCFGWNSAVGGASNQPQYLPSEGATKGESWANVTIETPGDYYFVIAAEIWTAGASGWTASYDNAYLIRQ